MILPPEQKCATPTFSKFTDPKPPSVNGSIRYNLMPWKLWTEVAGLELPDDLGRHGASTRLPVVPGRGTGAKRGSAAHSCCAKTRPSESWSSSNFDPHFLHIFNQTFWTLFLNNSWKMFWGHSEWLMKFMRWTISVPDATMTKDAEHVNHTNHQLRIDKKHKKTCWTHFETQLSTFSQHLA